MFKIDDYIICARNGVCKVMDVGVTDVDISDPKRRYYKLQPIYENGEIIYIPINADKIVMRKIISSEEANNLINNINSIEPLLFDDNNPPVEKYKEVMHTYECKELIRIIKTSYLRKKERLEEGKKDTVADIKYLKMAGDYLLGELSISLNIPKDQIKNSIVKSIKQYARTFNN